MRQLALSAWSLVLLAGSASADTNKFSYTCGSVKVEANFGQPEAASFIVDGKAYENIPNVQSGSGAKYEQGEGANYFMFWDHGGNALLQIGDVESPECTRNDG